MPPPPPGDGGGGGGDNYRYRKSTGGGNADWYFWTAPDLPEYSVGVCYTIEGQEQVCW